MQITLDTLSFVKFLEEKKHFTHEQAETLVEAAVDFVKSAEKGLATKHDIATVRNEIAMVKQELKFELKYEISSVRQEIYTTKKDIIIWLGSAIFLATGIIVGVMALMIK